MTVMQKRSFLRDESFIDQVKELAIEYECLELLRYLYEKFTDPLYELNYYREETDKHPYLGEVKRFKLKDEGTGKSHQLSNNR